MDISTFRELEKYATEIEYLASGSKNIDELTEYLKSKDVSISTIRDHKKLIKKDSSSLIKFSEPATVALNKEAIGEMISYLYGILKVEQTTMSGMTVDASLGNLKMTSGENKATINGLKKKIEELTAEVELYKEKVSELEQKQEQQFKAELELPIVVVSTEEVLPEVSAWEGQFVSMHKKGTVLGFDNDDKDETIQEESSQEQSEKKEGFILNYANYVKRGIKRMFTKSFMEWRVKKLLEQKGQTEFVSDKQYVNNILREPSFTNQQKLAMYAAFSDYRHSDFEKLLNFAGDNGIDANLLIQWAESLGNDLDYLQIKNALRQFAKPTEYKLKYDLAKELLLGQWQVEFYKDGVPTRFRLIAETDIEKIREKLGLSERAFTYYDFVTYEEMVEINVKKEEAMVNKKKTDNVMIEAPKFIERYFMKKNEIIFDDYDLDEEPINYEEFNKDEGK